MKISTSHPQLYFFTYGSCGHPFTGGWTEVVAESRDQAMQIFRLFHPDVFDGVLNCCAVYDVHEWRKTSMCVKSSNIGHGMWERISITRDIVTED